MKKLTTTIAALIATIAVADTHPCYTYLARTFYPAGKDNGVTLYNRVTHSSAGVEIRMWHQSLAYYDMTLRTTTVNRGETNSAVEFRPMVSAAGSAISGVLTSVVRPDLVPLHTTASHGLIVPWSDMCNLRGNRGQIEMWLCEPGKTNVLSYGIVRVDSN